MSSRASSPRGEGRHIFGTTLRWPLVHGRIEIYGVVSAGHNGAMIPPARLGPGCHMRGCELLWEEPDASRVQELAGIGLGHPCVCDSCPILPKTLAVLPKTPLTLLTANPAA